MTRVYIIGAEDVHRVLDGILSAEAGGRRVLTNENGKPYVEGGGPYFNVTHSGEYGAVAVSGKPVGIDVELLRGRSHDVFVRSLSVRERAEIAGEKDFLRHFTAREAYVKMKGSSVFVLYRHLEFFGGKIYEDGNAVDCAVRSFDTDMFVLSVCGGDGDVVMVPSGGTTP